MSHQIGRNAPLPGYMAVAAAVSSAAEAQIRAAARDVDVAARVSVSDGARAVAAAQHGEPFAWLNVFDSAAAAQRCLGPNLRAAHLGSGFSFGSQFHRSQERRTDRKRTSLNAAKDPPVAIKVNSLRRPAFEVRGFSRRSPTASGSRTQWHSGVPAHKPRPDLCIADLARSASRNAFDSTRASHSDAGLPLTALETAMKSQQRHVASVSIGKLAPRPPPGKPSASSGMSLFVKYSLVEPTPLTPRFATAMDNKPRTPSRSPPRLGS